MDLPSTSMVDKEGRGLVFHCVKSKQIDNKGPKTKTVRGGSVRNFVRESFCFCICCFPTSDSTQ